MSSGTSTAGRRVKQGLISLGWALAGVDIVPQTQLAQGAADYAIAWVPKALASREQGAGIVDVAQVFQRSGTLQVSWADSGISTPADLAGKKVGNWGFGNEYELFAGLTQAGLKPGKDVELVQQQFDMQALLNREIDAAQAMTYNEYAQVLEAVNPDTGELYQPEDFTVINWNDVGTAMYQDAIWASEERLADPAYQEMTQAFVTASLKGWIYCRDNAQEPPALDDERGQQAHLAVAARRRCHRSGSVDADGDRGAQHPQRRRGHHHHGRPGCGGVHQSVRRGCECSTHRRGPRHHR